MLKSDIKKFDEIIKIFFENDKIAKISNDLKFDIKVLNTKKITILGDIFDIKLAHYLINPDISHDLINLSNNYLNVSVNKKFEELKDYEVSCLTYKLKNLLRSDLEKFNQIKLYNEIEIPLLKTLAKMEIEGINLDVKFLKKLSERTTNE